MGVENHPRPRQQCPVIAPTVALPAARHRVTCNQVDGKTGTHTNSVIKYSSERVFPEQFSNRFIPIVGRSVGGRGRRPTYPPRLSQPRPVSVRPPRVALSPRPFARSPVATEGEARARTRAVLTPTCTTRPLSAFADVAPGETEAAVGAGGHC